MTGKLIMLPFRVWLRSARVLTRVAGDAAGRAVALADQTLGSAVGEVAGKTVAAVKGQVGVARALVTEQAETHMRNAQEELREEHVEIALYTRIEVFANAVGRSRDGSARPEHTARRGAHGEVPYLRARAAGQGHRAGRHPARSAGHAPALALEPLDQPVVEHAVAHALRRHPRELLGDALAVASRRSERHARPHRRPKPPKPA